MRDVPRGEGVVPRPDFYMASIGRSGSTLLCNWLTRIPDQLVFNEPFFCRPQNSRLLKIQLRNFGMPTSDDEWEPREESADERFSRLMATRLEGRRWGFKEVLSEEHTRVLDRFAPAKVLITVRNIVDVALSFFEKHRTQGNLERFSDEWVAAYCAEETRGILRFQHLLDARRVPYRVIRYEDVIRSQETLKCVEQFLGWNGGGDTAAGLVDFDRGFEVERHGRTISGTPYNRHERGLGSQHLELAGEIGKGCRAYQVHFGYDAP
jgi:hypothetical protein